MKTTTARLAFKGFTLLEVVIVLVVLGVIAGLSLPVVTGQVERSRAQEAVQHLDAVGDHMKAHRGFNGSYTGATFVNIRFNPNTVAAGQGQLFSYVLNNVTATTYTCTAQREPAGNNAGNTVVLNQVGDVTTVTRNGAYQ